MAGHVNSDALIVYGKGYYDSRMDQIAPSRV